MEKDYRLTVGQLINELQKYPLDSYVRVYIEGDEYVHSVEPDTFVKGDIIILG